MLKQTERIRKKKRQQTGSAIQELTTINYKYKTSVEQLRANKNYKQIRKDDDTEKEEHHNLKTFTSQVEESSRLSRSRLQSDDNLQSKGTKRC